MNTNNTDTNVMAGPQIMNQRQLAKYLGLCCRSVRNLEKLGKLPHIKLGKRTVYKMDSIQEALKNLEQQSTLKLIASVPNP